MCFCGMGRWLFEEGRDVGLCRDLHGDAMLDGNDGMDDRARFINGTQKNTKESIEQSIQWSKWQIDYEMIHSTSWSFFSCFLALLGSGVSLVRRYSGVSLAGSLFLSFQKEIKL